jgi:type III pantothenate kinase
MKLLIDLGNTRLKWALWDGAGLRRGGAVAHAGNLTIDFAALWKDISKVDAVFVASVAGDAVEDSLGRHSRELFGLDPQFIISSAAACGVRNAYAQPERLGVDRFLGLIAAHADTRGPTVIASCGTALTLDALATDGSHAGGLIAPSPALMQAALRRNTARLVDSGAARVVELADNTADAVESGTWWAAVALTERFFARATVRFGATPALILTGGGAQDLANLVTLPHRIDGDLVLRGLAQFAEEHEPDAPPTSAVG